LNSPTTTVSSPTAIPCRTPTNLDEARQLWRQELRFEFLDEKLKAPDMAVSGPANFDAKATW